MVLRRPVQAGLATVALLLSMLGSPVDARAAAAGTFLQTPTFTEAGLATVVFAGGTVAQLEEAARASGAAGAWIQDPAGAYRLLVIGGPPSLRDAFAVTFPGELGLTPVTLTAPRVAPPPPARAARTQPVQFHSPFPAPPPRTSPTPSSGSSVARIVSADLGLDHYIEDVGIVDGAMDTPADASYAVGWYDVYDLPGVPGNAVFSAHETWNHWQGPFYSLYRAQAGDEIDLDMVSGDTYRYRVISTARYTVDTMPMLEVIWPSTRPAGAQWITLLTCGGRLVYDESGFGEYLDRDVVVAERMP